MEGVEWPPDVRRSFVETVRGFGNQFVAVKPSWNDKGGGVILVHVRIEKSKAIGSNLNLAHFANILFAFGFFVVGHWAADN